MSESFKALVLSQQDDHTVSEIRELTTADLPAGDVLLAVEFSSLNYKDGLAVTGRGKIVREWPMVPGIDLAGRVLESHHGDYAAGDRVVLTGWGVGEKYWGGYSQRQRVQGRWLVPLPEQLDSFRAMAIGTAGFTAMLCVMTLEEAGVHTDSGTILVTGASGGVGSIAVAILHHLGYRVAAVTGKKDAADYLLQLGASQILDRDEMGTPPRSLESQRWAAAIDTVGGTMLARVLAETCYGGCVAACGLAGGAELPTTVMPFILRNVSLRGVDSVSCPTDRRRSAWQRLVTDLPEAAIGEIAQVVGLEQLPEMADLITRGKVRGRVIVNPNL
ncbi:MAG: oxidoreductase [Chromatiaceae bacterium]|nr:oxidoreductase [Gammaproteobacteria bacterium]MCP5301348.1 oxidoreductase [Chromatiaceae bacterium]MCP5421886.1 oxidoreductase [Chromatiaceae bacterium]